MVLGWRRAFCTSIPKDRDRDRDRDEKLQQCNNNTNTSNSPKPISKFGFFSNPSTPRLQSQPVSSPTLRCRTTANSSAGNSPRPLHSQASSATTESPRLCLSSNPSSPKSSPSSFSLLKSTLRLSAKQRSRCGICVQSVRSGQGTAIFTAECSHLFHFPCIAAHVKTHKFLLCPVCNAAWSELPLLAVHDQGKPISELQSSKLREVKIKSLRVYNDDEPLMSPTSGARFNPIPESNEDDDEEDNGPREFQGFFVNPTFSPSPKTNGHSNCNSHLGINVDVNLLPEAAVLAVGRGYETYAVMMRVKGLPASGARRAPIDLVTVLEVTGTMTGNKLLTLKRAMRLIISSLSESDRLSIVAFSAASKRLLPLRRMTTSGRRSARRIVDALGSTGQGMCVSDALKKAAKVLEDRRQKNSVASIVLLSGGSDERGPAISSTRFSHMDIPVHALTIGNTVACSNAPSDDDLAKCLGGLLSVVVQDLKLHLGFVSGSSPARISAVYSLTGKPAALGSGLVRLGDLFAEEEKELLVELRVPTSSSGSHHFLSVRPSYKDPSSGVVVHAKEQALMVPRPQAVRSSSPSIKRLRNLHVTVRAIAESRRLIEHSDFSGAHHLLSSARALLMKSSSGSTDEFLRGLEAEQAELQKRRLQSQKQREASGGFGLEKSEPLTPTSAWRAAERLAKVAIMRKSMNRVSDLHGFENARF